MQQEVDQLLNLYERRSISRRALIEGLAALVLGSRVFAQTTPGAAQESFVRARTLNHVTITTADSHDPRPSINGLRDLRFKMREKTSVNCGLKAGFLVFMRLRRNSGPGSITFA